MSNVTEIILSALAVLITLTIHEYAHGFAAYKLGDNTAKSEGRLSLNPIKHLDPVGAICMVLFHIGWAKPVPINPRNFKNPKRDFAICALMGPLTNIIAALFFSLLYVLSYFLLKDVRFSSEFLFNLADNFLTLLYLFHVINVGLGIFNLIPVPPLDGSRILTLVLPSKVYFSIMRHERQIYLALVAWLLLGDRISKMMLSLSFVASNPILSGIAHVLSLTGLISSVISSISGGMMSFWEGFFRI